MLILRTSTGWQVSAGAVRAGDSDVRHRIDGQLKVPVFSI